MSVQRETKAPLFLSLSCFGLGAKPKTDGKPGWRVSLISLGKISISHYRRELCVKSCQDIDLKPFQEGISAFRNREVKAQQYLKRSWSIPTRKS